MGSQCFPVSAGGQEGYLAVQYGGHGRSCNSCEEVGGCY